eukprot:897175-Rhodomonas_salina.1
MNQGEGRKESCCIQQCELQPRSATPWLRQTELDVSLRRRRRTTHEEEEEDGGGGEEDAGQAAVASLSL